MSSADAEVDTPEEAPFVYVGRKLRRPVRAPASGSEKRCPASSTSVSSVASGRGGFAYSSKAAKRDDNRAHQRAESNVKLFYDFLRPMHHAHAPTAFPATLQTTFEQVWSSVEGDASDSDDVRLPIPRLIVCLGLGSPTASRSAQIQLALLLALREHLAAHPRFTNSSDSRDIVSVAYDPIFTSDDIELLEKHSIKCSRSDINCTPSIEQYYTCVEEPTLLYMPHCDRSLYEDVLTRNSTDRVDELTSALAATKLDSSAVQDCAAPKLVLLANKLTNYLDAVPSVHHTTIPNLARLAPHMHSVALPNWRPTKSEQIGQIGQLWDTVALNDLAFQWM